MSGEAGLGQQGRNSKASLTGEGTCRGHQHNWEGPRAAPQPLVPPPLGPPLCAGPLLTVVHLQ